ncbi:hypothetical protein LGL08_00545 [Clostridium estertheticum]|uniref:hypothetical protein n=1 Tax=Clostridium estertheticum TaxID=238834 RepID=UPI001CF2C938|nr:hypothetical protein [Clostridium estertheticum]MCB2305703.1 hypothetical protein [Clostridium estertheticum]MCB2344482.1 hypothetical protein [Clostridium estertheticum]MCB2348058.1 hypothetical protein [Clostridium estertheticum]WAG45700.1 hypothetical protein LL127_19635 [Clostridium estertheticum]
MRLNVGGYILDVNIEKNKNFYKNEIYVSEVCECDGCQNYELAVEKVSLEVSKLFEQLGVDIKKPAEICVYYSDKDILCYGGFYHICGRLIEGVSHLESILETKESTTSHLVEDKMINITNDFKVSYQEECSLVSENFPTPCIQMEILTYLPWLLEKSNTY